jgi:4-hydroxy-tetrahydrodipicolinate synthase
MTKPINGILNILATPFHANLSLDLDSLRRLVQRQIDWGAYGFTILGVLGEAAQLTVDERRLVTDTVIETVANRVAVVVGVSHTDPKTVAELARGAFEAGADGVMVAPPPLTNPTHDNILAFYSELANTVTQPIVVQDFPPVNNVFMSADTLAALAERIPNIRHLKLEDHPLMEKISAVRARTDKYEIYGGYGGMFLLEELKRGAVGTMTGFAFTEVLVAVYQAFSEGRLEEAERIFDRFLPLIRFENQPVINLPLRKQILRLRGAIDTPALRLNTAAIDEGSHEEIQWLFKRVGIKDPSAKLEF